MLDWPSDSLDLLIFYYLSRTICRVIYQVCFQTLRENHLTTQAHTFSPALNIRVSRSHQKWAMNSSDRRIASPYYRRLAVAAAGQPSQKSKKKHPGKAILAGW